MDDRRFDGLARTVAAAGTTRRRALRGLGGGVIAALLTRFGDDEAGAKCVRIGGRCKKQGKKLTCCGGAKCKGVRCKCTGGRIACRGRCVAAECCTNADCGAGNLCAKGTCVTGQGTCLPGQDSCAAANIPCNGPAGCSCEQTTAGATRCGTGAGVGSCECTKDADCARFGPGAYCGKGGFAAHCPVCNEGTGRCRQPCPQ